MGKAMEITTVRNVAPGASLVAMVPLVGNSLSVRDGEKKNRIVSLFQRRQGAGVTRIVSPLMHDSSIGLQLSGGVGVSQLAAMVTPKVTSQDVLVVSGSGSSVALDQEFSAYMIHYESLGGVDANLIGLGSFMSRVQNVFSNTVTLASGVTGEYTGAVTISSAQDYFKANTEYALIGYTVASGPCAVVRFVGPDTGGLGVGGPGSLPGLGVDTAGYFINMARDTGLATIPVIRSANKALTFVDCATDENGADPVVTMIWAELA